MLKTEQLQPLQMRQVLPRIQLRRMRLVDYRLAITLLGLAAITTAGVFLIDRSYLPVSVEISLELGVRTNGEFVVRIPGHYALILTCTRSNLQQSLVDGFATSKQ